MYVIFQEDKLLNNIKFWSRNDMYLNNLSYETKYLFPLKLGASYIIDFADIGISNGYSINHIYVSIYLNEYSSNVDGLCDKMEEFKVAHFSNYMDMVERLHMIDITQDIDYIMDKFRPNILNFKFSEYVRSELLKKQCSLRDFNINEILK